jgi:hypothetical protein
MTNTTSGGCACGFGQYFADQGPKYDNRVKKGVGKSGKRRKKKKKGYL